MKNATNLMSITRTRPTFSQKLKANFSNVGDFFNDIPDKLANLRKDEMIRAGGGLALIVVLGAVAVTGAWHLRNQNTNTASLASIDRVDLQIAYPPNSFAANSSFNLPIHLYPNNNHVTGVELVVNLDNPSAASIIDVVPNANWAILAVKNVSANQARLVFVSQCAQNGCQTVTNPVVIATLQMRGSKTGGTTRITLAGTQVSVLGENSDMAGDFFEATIRIDGVVAPTIKPTNPNETPTPSPQVIINPVPTRKPITPNQ